MLIKDVWALYLKLHVKRRIMAQGPILCMWNLHLLPYFGDKEVLDVVQEDIDDYIEDRISGALPPKAKLSTARKEAIALKTALNYVFKKTKALSDEERREFPVLEFPPPQPGRVRVLSDREIAELFEQAALDRTPQYGERLSRLERFLWLGLETGARQAAIRKLKWSMVDFEADIIDYRLIDREQPAEMRRRTSKKRKAWVPMSPALRAVLLRERTLQEEAGILTDYVLDAPTQINDTMYRTALRARIPDVSPHVLRHTFATRKLAAGVSIWDVAKLLADTAQTVEKTYGHPVEANLKRAVTLGGIAPQNVSDNRTFAEAAE